MKYFLCFILCASLKLSQACSCNNEFSEFTPLDLFYHNHIIICKTISTSRLNDDLIYKAITIKNYWGKNNDTIVLRTSSISGMCGLPLDLKEQYLIYGNGMDTIYINHCSPSRKIGFNYIARFKKLGWTDSIPMKINGVYKRYSIKYIDKYYKEKQKQEINQLELIRNTKNGKLKLSFTNGKPSGEIELQDGEINGNTNFFYPDGKLMSSGKIIKRQKTGFWTEYSNEKIDGTNYYYSEFGNYINGVKKGKWEGQVIEGDLQKFIEKSATILNVDYGN